MERRHPSGGCSSNKSVRRRSGKQSPGSNATGSAWSPTQDSDPRQTWTFLAKDEDAIQRKSTVFLVDPLRFSMRHPSGPHLLPLPATSQVAPVQHNLGGVMDSLVHYIDPNLLSPANISYCSEASSLSMYNSNHSSESLVSLPTPNFMATHKRSFRSIFPKNFGFLSFGGAHRLPSSAFTMVTPAHRPQGVRSVSNDSTSSMDSATSAVSHRSNFIDGGHSSLILSINTTTKFTNKWPRPQFLRTLSTNDGSSIKTKCLNQTDAVLLEEGPDGEIRERWTIHKWCLLFSVVTVLAYGIACLACAVMTCFRSENVLLPLRIY